MADHGVPCVETTFPVRSGVVLAAKIWGVNPDGEDSHSDDRPAEFATPIIALHGFADNAGTFDLLAPLIVKNSVKPVRILCLDFAGHGRSEHRRDGVYTEVSHLHDTLDVAEQLGWRKFSLIGHSMGGAIALIVAAAGPPTFQIEKLILLDSAGPITRDGPSAVKYLRENVQAYFSRNSVTRHLFNTREDGARKRMGKDKAIAFSSALILTQRGMVPVGNQFQYCHDTRLRGPASMRFSEEQLRAIIASIEAPVLLVWAAESIYLEDGRKDPIKSRFSLYKSIKATKVPGGHHVHLDNAQVVLEALRPFLLTEGTPPNIQAKL